VCFDQRTACAGAANVNTGERLIVFSDPTAMPWSDPVNRAARNRARSRAAVPDTFNATANVTRSRTTAKVLPGRRRGSYHHHQPAGFDE